MQRKLLLLSNSTNPGEAYLAWPQEQIISFLKRHGVKKVLFIPYAGVSISYDEYESKVKTVFQTMGLGLSSIHHANSPVLEVRKAEAIVVGGGNTFHLVHELHRLGIMKEISQLVRNGVPYLGWSAGSNIAGPSLRTTNDMPIIEPASFNCMSLVPFQINPHYTDYFDPKHGGETRDDRIKEFTTLHPNVFVVGIREATSLLLENGKLSLVGRQNRAKVFHGHNQVKEYSLQDDLSFLMD